MQKMQKFLNILFKVNTYLLLLILILTAIGTFSQTDPNISAHKQVNPFLKLIGFYNIYHSFFYKMLWYIVMASLLVFLIISLKYKKLNISFYIIHISILLFFLGILIHKRYLETGEIALHENQTVVFKNHSITLNKFMIPKNKYGDPDQFISYVTVDKERKKLSVNHPLRVDNILFFQKSYQSLPTKFRLKLQKKEKTIFTNILIGLNKSFLIENNTYLILDNFWPDFYLDENNLPHTRSEEINNPMLHYFITNTVTGDKEEGFCSSEFFFSMHYPNHIYKITLLDIFTDKISVLGYTSITGIPFIFISGFLFILGVLLRLFNKTKIFGGAK